MTTPSSSFNPTNQQAVLLKTSSPVIRVKEILVLMTDVEDQWMYLETVHTEKINEIDIFNWTSEVMLSTPQSLKKQTKIIGLEPTHTCNAYQHGVEVHSVNNYRHLLCADKSVAGGCLGTRADKTE